MKWSVSESWKFGPFKLTVSKSGVSASVGVPGARVGVNTKGQANVRVGMKGFSYRKQKKIFPNVTKLITENNNE